MPNFIIIEVTGRNYASDTNDLRTALHAIIEEKCIRAGDIVLRDDRETDSLGNNITRDYRSVADMYRRRAELYRAARAERVARRGRPGARAGSGVSGTSGNVSGSIRPERVQPTTDDDSEGSGAPRRLADDNYSTITERDARLTFDAVLSGTLGTQVATVRYRDQNGRFARRPRPVSAEGIVTGRVSADNVRITATTPGGETIVASGGWCAPAERLYDLGVTEGENRFSFADYEIRSIPVRDVFVEDPINEVSEARTLPRHANGLLVATGLSNEELREIFEPGERFVRNSSISMLCTCCARAEAVSINTGERA